LASGPETFRELRIRAKKATRQRCNPLQLTFPVANKMRVCSSLENRNELTLLVGFGFLATRFIGELEAFLYVQYILDDSVRRSGTGADIEGDLSSGE
jgi:hypothetical protein